MFFVMDNAWIHCTAGNIMCWRMGWSTAWDWTSFFCNCTLSRECRCFVEINWKPSCFDSGWCWRCSCFAEVCSSDGIEASKFCKLISLIPSECRWFGIFLSSIPMVNAPICFCYIQANILKELYCGFVLQRLVAISGCGHLPHEECPKALLAALQPFITRLLPSSDDTLQKQ